MGGERNTQDCDFHCLLDKSSTKLEEAEDSCQPVFSLRLDSFHSIQNTNFQSLINTIAMNQLPFLRHKKS